MSGNITESRGNSTETEGGSPVGLAVGLTFFFLFFVIIACVIIYKYYTKIRSLGNFGPRESQEKEDCTVSPQAESHQYTSMIREQPDYTSPPVAQIPVYENLTVQAAGPKRSAAHPSQSPDQPEEDWYMQSDSPDDPIYNNYPAFKSNPPDQQDEDVYIVPDSL